LYFTKEIKAISTILLIILFLCAIIGGALISYLWVMGIYYKMPENTALLMVTNAEFAVDNARYFNVTILSPSNSISDANLTAIRLSVEGKNETYEITDVEAYGVTGTEPIDFPYTIRKGTEPAFKCKKNWSNFAGEIVRIEPVAANASTRSYSYSVPNVKLKVTPHFDEQIFQSIEYFNLTIENWQAEPSINLTISEIIVSGSPVNTTQPLPYVLPPNQTEIFRCEWNWEHLMGVNVTITVETLEGYESVYVTNQLPGAILFVDEIHFDYADTTYFNLTLSSSEYSTAAAIINEVNLTLADGTTMTLETIPPLHIIPIPILPNQSLTIKCLGWDWNMSRNETITVTVYTKQGFTAPSKTVRTPPAIVWNITDAKFDLDDVEHFTVNVTNMPCSLNGINVTGILLNGTATMDLQFLVLNPGEQGVINCTVQDWTNFRGADANITAITQDGLNASIIVTVPSVNLTIAPFAFFDNSTIIPYVNITISNAAFSSQNVTIKQITFTVGNVTYAIDGGLTTPSFVPSEYVLTVGASVTMVCPWNWTLYRDQSVTVTVQTQEGASTSQTFDIS
jgi:hypothetical protein